VAFTGAVNKLEGSEVCDLGLGSGLGFEDLPSLGRATIRCDAVGIKAAVAVCRFCVAAAILPYQLEVQVFNALPPHYNVPVANCDSTSVIWVCCHRTFLSETIETMRQS
jgi:hypothetical protein